MVITGARFGKNGYTIERNTRYTTHFGGNTDMLKNLVHGRQLNGWTLRKTMEAQAEYEGAVAALKAAPYASTEYSIISGVRKGTILSRDPDSVAFVQELGKPGGNPMCEDDYIIITNFDYYWHDVVSSGLRVEEIGWSLVCGAGVGCEELTTTPFSP